jgi:hypothetical protein
MAFNEKMDIDSKAVQHSEATNDTELEAEWSNMIPNGETVRGLKSRHLQLIALGCNAPIPFTLASQKLLYIFPDISGRLSRS